MRIDKFGSLHPWRAVALAGIAVLGVVSIVGSGGGGTSSTAQTLPAHAPFLQLRDGGSNGKDYYAANPAISANGDTLDDFRSRNGFNVAPPGAIARAKYFNAGDLNLGRDMNCLPNANGGLACYVANHAVVPASGVPFSGDPAAAFAGLKNPAAVPFATVAMESYVETTAPVTKFVRECDGLPTAPPPRDSGSCNGEEPPPIFGGGVILPPAPGKDVDTGIDVNIGDVLTITATGTIDAGVFLDGRSGPEGWNFTADATYPVPGAPRYALIGRIGSTATPALPLMDAFLIGAGTTHTHTGVGQSRLYLRTNDDLPGNGYGHFDVTVTVRRAAPSAAFYVYVPNGTDASGRPLTKLGADGTARLDSEGDKQVPGICLSCHGGTYDKTTNTVSGAAFLPFNLKSFKYDTAPGLDRAAQEESLRKLNAMVRSTRPQNQFDPIVDFIDGMYPLGVQTPLAVARDDYVPAGWVAQPNLYLGIIRPYCAGCHIALGSKNDLDFTRLAQVQGKAGTVQNLVCGTGLKSMPHSEVAFDHFWTDAEGFLPTYLQNTLPFSSCTR
jgi:mono/diheme cytochrome c family protein